ncbi:MAG: type II toxin-antitoxin system mRNA interferase toxin, RelE/StbE family [Candidatus Woesearchaeota archaeon]
MEYYFEFSKEFEKSIRKLKKKDRKLFSQIQNKLLDIIEHPEHYKPLRNSLSGYRRIHFGSFVLVYKIRGDIVKIISLDHHDKAY